MMASRTCGPCPSRSGVRGSRPSIAQLGSPRFDLSPLVVFAQLGRKLEALRSAPPHPVIEGVMLKRQRFVLRAVAGRAGPCSNGSATRTPWMRF